MAVMPNISWMELTAPNIHYIPAPALAAVGKVKFEDDVFLPTDEPRSRTISTLCISRNRYLPVCNVRCIGVCRGLIKLVLSQAIPAKL